MARQKGLPSEAFLASRPTANQAVRTERRGEELVLWIPIQKRLWMNRPFSWFFPYRSEKGAVLDRLGEEVWQACDGKHTTEQIVEQFAARHQLRFHEARLSVMQFLRMLVRRNLVAMVVPEQSESER